MTVVNPEASRQAVVEAALERMGLTPADLAAVPHSRRPVPTFAEYIPVVSAAVSTGTRRAYGSYWNLQIMPPLWSNSLSAMAAGLAALRNPALSFAGRRDDDATRPVMGCPRRILEALVGPPPATQAHHAS
jgi:hypothetical protein